MPKRNREQTKEYFRNQRAMIRGTRVMRKAGLVDASFFIDNPRLLAQIRIWLSLGEDCTRKAIQEIAIRPLPKAEIDKVIRVATKGQ